MLDDTVRILEQSVHPYPNKRRGGGQLGGTDAKPNQSILVIRLS